MGILRGSRREGFIEGSETALGVPEEGEGKLAGAVQIGLENGGLATVIMNYLTPP